MNNKQRIVTLVFALANLGLMVYGWIALLVPSTLMDSYTANVYAFPAEATAAIQYQNELFRLIGFFNLLLGLAGTIVLWRWTVNQGTWKLRSMCTLTGLAYLGQVLFDQLAGKVSVYEVIEYIILAAIVAVILWLIPELRTPADKEK